MTNKHQPIIISLGGSTFVPEKIDVVFLKKFKEIIIRHIEAGRHFIVITGGGKTSRTYHAAAEQLSDVTTEDLDWVGIYTTRFHAHFMRYVFKGYAHDAILTDPTKIVETDKPLVIGAGWHPGNSTDLVAVVAAETLGAQTLINLSNIDHVYDSDPKQNAHAKKYERISWSDYRKLIPEGWQKANLSTPFDPVASQRAHECGIEVAIMNGTDLSNFEAYLNGRPFQGTTIHA